MKSKNREFIVLVILIPIILYGAFFISTKMNSQFPAYSVLNKSHLGTSVFYEALINLGYPVERTENPVQSFSTDSIQIVADANFGRFDIYNDDLNEWVKKGGILVYLTPAKLYFNLDDLIPEYKGEIEVYEIEEGYIIVSDVTDITNKTLIKETNKAYKLLELIDEYNYDKLYFNETHLYTGMSKMSLWDFTPLGVKFILYQILITLFAYFYFKGRRFGKPIPYIEEKERVENEYLYSAAALYRQAGSWDLILENYYHDFLKEIAYSEDDWLEYWKGENLPSLSTAKKVYQYMNNKDENIKEKGAIQIINSLEKLKYHLQKRSEKHWKRLKE